MRHFIAAFFLLATGLFAPALPAAIIVGQCALDQTVTAGSDTYAQCPFGDTNNFLSGQGYSAARLEPNNILSLTPIFQYDSCRYVDARGTTNSLFVPFGNAGDWNSFIGNVPSGVASTQCCVPRTLRVGDAPVPTAICNNGNWRVEALVSPLNFNTVLATPIDALSLTSGFTVANGITEDPRYPLTSLPIERGDIGSVLPNTTTTANNLYVARFRCGFGRQPVGLNSVVEGANAQVNAEIGDVAYTQFRIQCSGSSWTPIDPTSCVNTKIKEVRTCQQDGYGVNFTGAVYYIVNQICQSGGSKLNQYTKILDTCTNVCVPGDFGGTFTETCPVGQTGLITKTKVRECPSGNVTERVISNTCVASCTPGQEGSTFTQACGADKSGLLTLRNVRQCPANVLVTETVSDTCQCIPSRNLPDEVRNCPDGFVGAKTYSVVRTCFGRQPVGSAPKAVSDICSCSNTETLKSDTCVACVPGEVERFTENCPDGQTGLITKRRVRVCPAGTVTIETVSNTCTPIICTPSDNTVTNTCPSGQTGQILVRTQHICDGSNGGYGRDVITTTNQCTPVVTCTPSDTTTNEACPSGQTGQIVVRTQHVCDGSNGGYGRDVITRTNQCVPACTPGEVSRFTETCPAGYNGLITKRHVRVCPSGQITEELVSNTCTAICNPSDRTVSQPCPVGYMGQILVRTQHVCDGSNGGFGRDVVTTINQCEAPSIPEPTSGGHDTGGGGC